MKNVPMDTLKTISEIIHRNTSTEKVNIECWNYRPIELTGYETPKCNLPDMNANYAKGVKSKLKTKMSKVLAFIDLESTYRLRDKVTEIPIPQTNKRLQSIFGNNAMSVNNYIKFMIQLGLIEEHIGTYQIGEQSKKYRYFYDNELLIKDYCKLNNINRYKVINNNYIPLVKKCKIDSFDEKSVRFSSNLHLHKPDDYSQQEFEKYIYGILLQNYPQLSYYQMLADEINNTYYENYPEFRISFVPKFTWNSKHTSITKIGIRATNMRANAVKDNSSDKVTRDEIRSKYNLTLEKDVTSSVPRITYSLNNNKWLNEDIDLYNVIVNKLLYIPLVKKCKTDERQAVKECFMYVYFGKEGCEAANLNFTAKLYTELSYSETKVALEALKEAVFETIGDSYGSEIFFHESCLYMEVLKVLLDNDFFVWQVYDCWYAKHETCSQEEFESFVKALLPNIFEEYFNKFMNF